ncbi:MAG: hypothetical protein PHH58_15975 [Rhodoferax sp.]|nr:hypothetical protein [Rhodoferax sp.]
MLISTEQFSGLVVLAMLIVFGPVVAGMVWINRHADWFRSLKWSRQLWLSAVAPMGWILLVGVPLLNYPVWVDVAKVWLVRDSPGGISKQDMKLVGTTPYRFANGRVVTLRADAKHYQMIVNDSTRTLHRNSVFYGDCTEKSPYTLGAVLGTEADLDIPSATVLDNPSLGLFGDDPANPPQEITITLPRHDDFPRCEQVYWYAPLH